MLAITKTKIGIASLVLASFVIGGIAFNAYQVGAFGGFHRFGFFGGGCDLSGLEKGTPEWQAKVDECKVEKQAQMGEFKTMTPEERQAKMEEMRANWPDNMNMPFKGRGHMFGHMFGPKGLDGVNHQVQNISNGVQITVTSDNPDTVTKLQEWAAKLPVANQ